MNDLVRAHRPIIKLHHAEKFFPVGWDWWLQNSTRMSPPAMSAEDQFYGSGRTMPLGDDGTLLPNDFAKLKKTQGLYHVMENADGSTDIAYMMLWAYNGPKRIVGLAPMGGHVGDVEIFYAHIMPNGELGFYGLSTHGEVQVYDVHPTIRRAKGGAYDTNATVDKRNGRPIAYSAVNAHALYGKKGSYFRLSGFANDNTADGPEVDFEWTPAEQSRAFDDNGKLGSKINKGELEGSVLPLKMQLYQEGYRVSHIPRQPLQLYRKVVPHFRSLQTLSALMWLPYLLYLVVPLLTLFLTRSKRGKKKSILRWLKVLAVFVLQFYVLKFLVYFFDSKFGITHDQEDIWGFVFPFRFY